jgi:long-subunit acyl-CoA synthetase (AMP-forming)
MLLVMLVSSTHVALNLSSRRPKPLWHILPRFKAMVRLLLTEVLKGCVKFSPDDREYKSLHFEPALVVFVARGYQQNLSTLQSKSDRQLSP